MATKQSKRITHEAVELYRRARRMVLKHGTSDSEGGLTVSMTHGAFSREFGRIDDLRDAIDVLEGTFPRVGFFIMRDQIEISFNLI